MQNPIQTNQSIFMQMHNGTRTGEGSFNVGLKELFYIASQQNRRKLVDAFPEFFGDEISEFEIFKKNHKVTSKQINLHINQLIGSVQIPNKKNAEIFLNLLLDLKNAINDALLVSEPVPNQAQEN